MDSAIPTPAKAMMSGPCFVLCANHSTKNALFCNMVRKGGCASTFKRLPVRTALMSSSALAECLVSESARQSSLRTCARSCICPLLLSFLNIWIKCIVSFCSGWCVVDAVVTRLFASVRMCTSAVSPVMSRSSSCQSKLSKKHVNPKTSDETLLKISE